MIKLAAHTMRYHRSSVSLKDKVIISEHILKKYSFAVTEWVLSVQIENTFSKTFLHFVLFFLASSNPREKLSINCFLPNRRLIHVKEMEILGHLTTEWDYLFEHFTRCPCYEANVLKVTVLVRKTCKYFLFNII